MSSNHQALAGEINRMWTMRLGLLVAACFAFATMLPAGLVLAAFSSLLTVGALASALLAALAGERLWSQCLTRWDQAAVLLLLSLVTGWSVDPEAASDAIMRLEGASAGAS